MEAAEGHPDVRGRLAHGVCIELYIPRVAAEKQRRGRASSLLSPRRVGDLNRSRVLRALTDHGPLYALRPGTRGRASPGRRWAPSCRASSTRACSRSTKRSPQGAIGKPARPGVVRPRRRPRGRRVGHRRRRRRRASSTPSAPSRDRQDVRSRTARCGRVADAVVRLSSSCAPKAEPVGVGVAVPGVCDTEIGEVLGSGQVPGAARQTASSTRCRRVGLPVFIDNDSRAQALAERWFGARARRRHVRVSADRRRPRCRTRARRA